MGRATLLLLLGLSVNSIHASIFCPHTVYPSDSNDLIVASIQGRQRPGQEAYYRITDDNNDPAYQKKSSRFRLMTSRDSGECPFRGCLVELSPAEPKNHGTLLYQTSVIGKMIPPGFFAMDVSRRLYCVVTDGDCGATIPLYRHYRLTPTGIYHAYTLEADETIEGYAREPAPLCYVWPKDKPNQESQVPAVSDTPSTLIPPLTDIIEKLIKPATTPEPIAEKSSHSGEDNALIESDDLCEGADRKAFDSSMKKLREYYNGESGAKSDHWYTTIKKPGNVYKPKAIMGKVVTDIKNTNCKCLIQLSQMKFESDDKNILDHKLTRTQIEPLSLYQYKVTGEEIYCARKEGACGATVPLRKFYNLAESDSLLTVNSEDAPPNSNPSPAEVLCWIWPKNYHQDSTEEELHKENMNVVKTAKVIEESTETIEEGSGAEIPKTEKSVSEVKKVVKDEPKVEKPVAEVKEVSKDEPKVEQKPVAKKAKKEKKSKKRSKKPKSAEKKVEEEVKKSSEVVEKTAPKSIEAEEQFGADKVLRFENVDENKPKPTAESKPKIVEEPKVDQKSAEVPKEKSAENTSLLDEDEERVRELAKFQNKKAGKEPIEIEQQQDEASSVLHFEDIASH